ncbi:MAG: arylformamidase [Maricaulis sp.]|uniref:arylformamidase n=1 Tax=Maricaulis sp. TaxID=1486257 RepID=UPI001AFEE5B7|nr:arylformamidase [Maricaulis sp.]MBO6728477.1 arylformamidase [Maricaulis sp.]MBO6846490.1 arylformamidase [Maricaulis sp.]MBO6876721.1 arylformamidase [Maricaulis sp.]
MRKIWDISQPLRPDLPVWPGDTAFQREDNWVISEDCPVKVSRLTLSTHSGAHADAPEHYDRSGQDIASVALDPFLGDCVLVTAGGTGIDVTPEDLDWGAIGAHTRVLVRTYERFPHAQWDSEFRAVNAATIERLAAAGCKLIGTDAASLDPETSKTLNAHHAVKRHDMRILEGLVFDGVPDGRYELIALPLPIVNADASPVRAILREI